MMHGNGPPLGLVLGSATAPEHLSRAARVGEELGFEELWFAEDYFFTGGIAAATAALAVTRRIPVGLGIVSAMVRHPAVLAMEVATAARMFPDRLRVGIGLGVPAWMRQMGLLPRSPLTALRECTTSVRRLLDGDELTSDGAVFAFDRVRLTYPLAGSTPLYMGVTGLKGLELSGELADGTLVSILASLEYVRLARERIAVGAARSPRGGRHRVVVFVAFSVDADGRKAKRAVRDTVAFYLAGAPDTALTQTYGIADELRAMVARGGAAAVARELPDSWLDDLVVAGDPDECAARISAYLEAGADSVALFPLPADGAERVIELAAAEIMPRLG